MQDKVLELSNVNAYYKDGKVRKQILKDISFTLYEGEIVGLVGESGSGKTTLLNLILGITDISSGKIIYDGEDITNVPLEKRGFNIVFQDYALFPNLTAYENIVYGLRNKPGISTEQDVQDFIHLLGLEEHLNKRISQLSGGQKQRVAIVRALIMHPEVLLLDEITAALDPEMVREVLDVVLALAQEGRTMVIVTHEMQFAKAVADRMVFLEGGKIVEEGNPKEFFEDPKTDRLRKFLQTFTYEKGGEAGVLVKR